MHPLEAAADAYAAGHDARGAALFDQAHDLIQPLIVAVIRRRCTEPDMREQLEDIAQDATIRIWRSVTKGQRVHVERYAASAAADAYRRHRGRGATPRPRMHHHVEAPDEGSKFDTHAHAGRWHTTPSHEAAIVDRLSIVTTVESVTMDAHPIRREIAAAALADWDTTREITTAIGATSFKTVRRHLEALRDDLRSALGEAA